MIFGLPHSYFVAVLYAMQEPTWGEVLGVHDVIWWEGGKRRTDTFTECKLFPRHARALCKEVEAREAATHRQSGMVVVHSDQEPRKVS
jgi:hypothetical protein